MSALGQLHFWGAASLLGLVGVVRCKSLRTCLSLLVQHHCPLENKGICPQSSGHLSPGRTKVRPRTWGSLLFGNKNTGCGIPDSCAGDSRWAGRGHQHRILSCQGGLVRAGTPAQRPCYLARGIKLSQEGRE